MYISKLSLPRRTFLRGAGAALALPLLEAMVPAMTAAAKTAANPTPRFGAIYLPHGAMMPHWTPEATGSGFELSPILKPLEPFRDSLVVVSNLSRPRDDEGGSHAVSAAGWLSGTVAKRTQGEDVHLATTIDQVIAKQVGQDTPFPSLELATEDFSGFVGGCDTGWSCVYMNTLSWQGPTAPLPMEINPRVVFERMFGGTGTREERVARMRTDRSILDSIRQETNAQFGLGLGSRDRLRVTEYLDNIREIERRIQRAEAQNGSGVRQLDAPMGVPESFEEHVALMFDLLAIAFQTDITRVFTFMMARELSMRTYLNLDLAEPHHSLSHHLNKPEKIAGLVKLQTYHVQLFGKFLEKLRATPDGDGSLLDHSMILYGSGMSDSNAHSPDPLPLMVLGGAAGRISGDRHVKAAEHTPMANLLLSMADKFGVEMPTFGVSTGRVAI
jgi:hypothetical protein